MLVILDMPQNLTYLKNTAYGWKPEKYVSFNSTAQCVVFMAFVKVHFSSLQANIKDCFLRYFE